MSEMRMFCNVITNRFKTHRMNSVCCLWLIIAASICSLVLPVHAGSTPSRSEDTNLPPLLNNYIDEISTNVPFLELPDFVEQRPPSTVSKAQALEDITMIEYLLDTAYSGRTYWANHSIDFPSLFKTLRSEVNNFSQNEIPVARLEEILFKYLENMTDGHTKIIGQTTRELAREVRSYFAQVIVEKKGQEFIVVESLEKNISVGDKYTTSPDYLFKTLSKNGTEQYLIGVLSTPRVETLSITFNGKPQDVRLHPCRIEDLDYRRSQPVESGEVQTIPVVRVSSFLGQFDKQLRAFAESGKTLKGRKVIVWNLLSNDGGDSGYARQFVENLNGSAAGFQYLLTLHSPAIAQAYMPGKNLWLKDSMPAEWLKADVDPQLLPPEVRDIRETTEREAKQMRQNPRMEWEITPTVENTQGQFKGKLVVLSNNRVGSAANNALAMAKSVPGCIVVGSNSSGGFTFADVVTFCLRNTYIKLRLPRKLIVHPDFDNQKGFIPDLWLDSAKPVEEVTRWLSTPETYQFSYRS